MPEKMERERQKDVLMTVQTEIPGRLVLGKAPRAFGFDFIDFQRSSSLALLLGFGDDSTSHLIVIGTD